MVRQRSAKPLSPSSNLGAAYLLLITDDFNKLALPFINVANLQLRFSNLSSPGHSSYNKYLSCGQLAQLVARFLDMEEVTGSNPVLPKSFYSLLS